VDIHVATIMHTEFRKYEKPGSELRLVEIEDYGLVSPRGYATGLGELGLSLIWYKNFIT